jgi:hypothetical protein
MTKWEIRKKVVTANFKVASWHFLGTEENRKKPQSG